MFGLVVSFLSLLIHYEMQSDEYNKHHLYHYTYSIFIPFYIIPWVIAVYYYFHICVTINRTFIQSNAQLNYLAVIIKSIKN